VKQFVPYDPKGEAMTAATAARAGIFLIPRSPSVQSQR
jgi:hypothetical protein